MDKPVFLFPTEAEAAVFRQLMPEAEVVIIGVGMAEAAAMTARYLSLKPTSDVVLCGIAGVCDERLAVGQVVEVVYDRIASLPGQYAKEYRSERGTGLESAESFTVNASGEALRYVAECGLPAVEQMEGAAVAAMCEAMGVEHFYHIRAISNRVGDSRDKWRIEEAVAALGGVVSQLFK